MCLLRCLTPRRSKVRSPDERAYAGTLRLAVKRSSVFEDSFNKLRSKSPQEMRGKLSVAFVGEEGIDAGGVSREWYQVRGAGCGCVGGQACSVACSLLHALACCRNCALGHDVRAAASCLPNCLASLLNLLLPPPSPPKHR